MRRDAQEEEIRPGTYSYSVRIHAASVLLLVLHHYLLCESRCKDCRRHVTSNELVLKGEGGVAPQPHPAKSKRGWGTGQWNEGQSSPVPVSEG